MRIAGATVTNARLPIGKIIWASIGLLILALIVTGFPIIAGFLGAADEGRLIAVETARQTQQQKLTPLLAWQAAEVEAQDKSAAIPIETFFVDPDGTVRFTYVKTVDTPIWSQVEFLKPLTSISVAVKGSPSYY